MAKIRRMRQKLHNAAQKKKQKDKQATQSQTPPTPATTVNEEMMDSLDAIMGPPPPPPPPPPADPTALGARGDNLFKDVRIQSLDLVKQKLPDFDARSAVSNNTLRGLNLTKKEKRRIRHDAFMAKIDHIKAAEKKAKESKKKSQTPIIGNMDPMLDALPTLELLMKSSPKHSKEEVSSKVRSTQPERKRKKKMLDDISLFQQVLKHPLFVEDEKRTITEHLKIALEKDVIM